ncbi:MAG: DUF1844 domain-containing protein [Candidatus Marinimicrobia bacterium]|jgi:hypothetical protein|nr:DUF1844 domain-containing protein [Candidatus Neomarinimicrobiota bacterium]MBT3618067.1 DUF1844 domain-containing protein [Candidatus Neomarinimicrobiota bacterium]MBT3828476.1 DUF1844 domain-containing protein [Candidatus Neomarinimicrobiota bacterium]MBT3998053.1 DUF1844 domain-containing protein [Candidatus Neomarinimicrobiota bacterium]MBT4280243.1 DUF1844 domain-containing protein [Candidatus Neomarinimicrobiota bacterium]
MSTTENNTQDPLFVHLVSTFTQSAWISMGKVKNPVSDALEHNLEQASFYIDLLDMLQKKMTGNLSEWEIQFLSHSVSELKLNFIDEKNKKSEPIEEDMANTEGDNKSDAESKDDDETESESAKDDSEKKNDESGKNSKKKEKSDK